MALLAARSPRVRSSRLCHCVSKDPRFGQQPRKEYKYEKALVYLFTETDISTRLCDSVAYKKFNATQDRKFKTPGSTRINSLNALKMQY